MARKLGVLAAICCVFALCFTLVGCGESIDKTKYTGDWKLAYGSDENLDADSIKLMESLGLTVKLTLNEDGTNSLDLFGESMQGTWEATSNTEGKITLNGSEANMKLENEELTIVDSTNSSMTFKR